MKQEIVKKVERYLRTLRNKRIPVERVFVFGSAARGEQNEWSDIDVGVISQPFASDRIEEMTQLQLIANEVDVTISPFPLRSEDLNDRFSVIGQAIRREGKEIRVK